MEGKLFKMVEGYTLSLTGCIDDLYGISDKQLAEDHQLHKLSLKNCEAIANGYDLVELFDEVDESIDYQEFDFSSFKLGFKKAIEILGDKKFSEKELTMLFAYGHQIGMNDVLAIQSQHSPQPMPKPDSDKLRDELIQSLQQTEWDVTIEVERSKFISDKSLRNDIKNGFNYTPKLDADGCLILKRK